MFGNQKIFVSHTHEDNQRCQPLLAAFDAWQLDYWFDLQELGVGQRFSDRIEQELGDRDILIRVGTTAAMRSFWMNRELRTIRGLQTATPQHPRLILHLILTPDYVLDAATRNEVVIDTTKSPRATWLHELHQTLGLVPTAGGTGRRVGRRAAIGIVVLSLAALATTGTAATLYLKHPPTAQASGFAPQGSASTMTPQPSVERLRWQYDTALEHIVQSKVSVTSDSTAVYAANNETIRLFAQSVSDGKALWNYPPTTIDDQVHYAKSLHVSADSVYVTGAYYTRASDTSTYQFIALDKTTGVEKWRADLDDDSEFASDTCVTANGLFFQSRNKLVALGLDGKPLWPSVTLAPFDLNTIALQRTTSTPTYANDVVYVGNANGKLYAVDAAKGYIRWSVQVTPLSLNATVDLTSENATMIETDIATANGLVFVGANDGQLRAFNAVTGALRWSTPIVPSGAVKYEVEIVGTPIVADGVLYLSAGRISDFKNYTTGLDHPAIGQLFAVDAASGKILWMLDPLQALSAQNFVVLPNLNPPVIRNTTAYFPIALSATLKSNTNLGMNILLAINKSTGAVQWHYEVALNAVYLESAYSPAASLIEPDGVVLASCDGKITALNT